MPDEPLIVTDVLHGYAGRLAYHPAGDVICFDKIPEDEGDDRYFDLWTMTARGNVRQCLTRDKPPPFTTRHIGQPAYHPSGDWIVYQGQKEDSDPLWDAYARPGSGMQNDVYVMPSDATTTTRVYASEPVNGGVLHPHFNAYGSKLSWTEYVGEGRTALGHWVLKQAAFVVHEGAPAITNIQTADPGLWPDWLENHGFDPSDDSRLIVSGNPNGELALRSNIYIYDARILDLCQLTENARWEEHAHFSPDGEWIVFMRGLTDDAPLDELETELWIMRRDGTRQRQLTFFHTVGHPHFVAERGVVCADSDWHPDGRQLAVFTQSPHSSQGEIRLCALNLDLVT